MQVIQEKKNPMIIGQVSKKPVNTESIEAMTPETDRPVRGTFKNLESPGNMGFVGCLLYKGMPYWQKWFDDGEEATIPLSVARHINENTSYPIQAYLLDSKGNYMKGTGKIVQRYQFVSTDFS